MDNIIYDLAEKIKNRSKSIEPCCNGIMLGVEDKFNIPQIKSRLSELKNVHYKIGEFIEEIDSHIYNGGIDDGR